MELLSVGAAAHIEAGGAASQGNALRGAIALDEARVAAAELRHVWAQRREQRIQLHRPRQRRRARAEDAAPSARKHGQHKLRAHRVLALQVVRLVGDAHGELRIQDGLQEHLLVLAVGDEAKGQDSDRCDPECAIMVRLDEIDVAGTQEWTPALELFAPR